MESLIKNIIVKNLSVGRIRASDINPDLFLNIDSHQGLKKALKKGLIRRQGQILESGNFIYEGDAIEEYCSFKNTKQYKLDLEVLYEDEHLAAVNKPPGIESSGNQHRNLANALSSNLKKNSFEPKLAHRLDYLTSGVILIGKSARALKRLNESFSSTEIEKQYLAVAIGDLPKEISLNYKVDEKEALTHFKKINSIKSQKYGHLNLLIASPQNGRRHQIRKHLFENGTPVFGDKTYYLNDKISKGNGMYLHAWKVSFKHPIDQLRLDIEAPIPKKFKRLFKSIS